MIANRHAASDVPDTGATTEPPRRFGWLRRPRKPVRVILTNGLGWDFDTIELVPGQTVQISVSMTRNVCDRGFGSKDGTHRLTSKTYNIPMQIRLEDRP